VVFGDRDDVGVTESERRILENCPRITLITIPDVGHFTLNVVPGRVAEILLEAVSE
jgi:pimeloyl-ACP methyl ester carboxylesterase